jgi:hypothetical protein
MAELYSRPVSYVDIGNQANKTNLTGNPEINAFIDSLPEEEKQKALEQYNSPLTGEEVAQALMMSPTFVPTVKEYKAYKEYQATKSTDIFDGIANAAGAVVDDLARGIQGAGQDPSKIPASLVEAFAQGTRNLYGMVAQSQDPDSILFKWKDALSNSYSDEGYRQFLEARDFNRESIDLLEGKSTVLVNKDLVNHDVVQAASYIADPTLFIPFGGIASKAASIVGMGQRLAAVTARASAIKNMMYAGALKYGAGVPLEFIGNATRKVIDKGISAGSSVFETATGISAKEATNYVRTAGFGTTVSGVAGYPVPYASAVSGAYLKANVASGLGESLTAIADQMLKNQGRRGYMSFAEAAIRQSDDMLAKGGQGLSPHARKLLNVIDKADPMFAYAMEGLEGAAMGSAIGGGLGYLSGGEEGLAGGIGSGAVLGGVGGVAGRVVSDVAGASLKAERKVQADLVLEIMKDADPAKFTELSRLRAIAEANGDNIDAYIAGIDLISPNSRWASGDLNTHEAYLIARGQDPKTFDGFERNQDGSYKLDDKGNKVRLLDEQGFEVPTMQQFDGGAGWTMARNSDGAVKIHINTTRYNSNTVPHELFHAIFREEAMKPEFKNRLARAILGTFDENGKMVGQPTISQAESRAFFENYIKAENKGNAETIADNLSLLDKALTEYYKDGTMSVMSEDGKTPYLTKLTEEFGAFYFTQFIKGKRPDFLFRGGQYSGMRGLIETVKTGWLDYMERKITSVNPTFDFNRPDQTINPAFRDASGKRIRVSALDHLMTDIVKATSQTNRNGSFDFRTLSPEGQEAYVRANGLSRTYRKRANGKYERMNKPEQAAYDKARGIEIFKAINGLPPEALIATDANGVVTHELIAVRDAKGNILHYEGTIPPAVLDHLQRTGYLDAPEKLRIQQLQDIVAGRTKSNIIEFIYHGREEGIAEGADIRVSGDAVSVKSRVALVLAMNNKIKANGEHSFTALTLDWRNIKMRGEKLWADPAVRKMWNDDQSAFQGDFFRYLENASLPEGERVPSAQLWQVDGEKKRNIMHQFAGMQRTGVINGKGGSYFNAPNAEIVNDITASITNFRTEGMGKITLTNDIVKFNPEGIKPIQMNFMPSEMSSENTPNGNIRTTKDGYKFIEDATGVKVYKPNGDLIGKYSTAEEAQAKALQSFQKENPNGKPIPSVDNIRNEPADAPETLEQYITRKMQVFENPETGKDFINKDKDFHKWVDDNGIHPNAFDYYGKNNIELKGNELAYVEKYFKEKYFKEQQAVNPTFVSGLSVALDKILSANVNKEGTIQASRLLNLMDRASGGDIGKILTESNAIGFTDWLKSKKDSRVSEAEIRQYIKDNGIKVSLDPRTDIRGNEWQGGGFDTSTYVAEGKKDGYYTFVARINPEHAHGVEGHFGGDSIVHIRTTIRTDAQGRKVLFVEEIQSINTAREALPEVQRKVIESDLVKLKSLDNELSKLKEKQTKLTLELVDRQLSSGENEARMWEKYGSYAEVSSKFRRLNTLEEKALIEYLNKEKEIVEKYNIDDFSRGVTESFNYSDIQRLISEKESLLAKKKSDKPLQDFNETVKIASRTIMRKAVELGADRVVLVRPEDMHPDVSVNAEGERFVDTLYGRDIPAMINAELKKYGQKLAPARNYGNQDPNAPIKLSGRIVDNYGKSYNKEAQTKLILSESLGYDITPKMKQEAGRSQTFMMPSEGEYRSGDNYWKAKENKFEGVDENGQTYRLASAIINGKVEFNPDPDNVSWMDIGHSNMRMPNQKVYEAGNLRNKPVTSPDDYVAKMRDGLWAINSNKPNDIMIYKPPENAQPRLDRITHDEWLREYRDSSGAYGKKGNITTGRYEKPIYKDGKLIERGRLSMQAYGEITSLEQAKKIKEQVAKKLGFKSEDFDAYVFDNEVKEKLGISRKDQLPVRFMPSEGEQGRYEQTKKAAEKAWGIPIIEDATIAGMSSKIGYKGKFKSKSSLAGTKDSWFSLKTDSEKRLNKYAWKIIDGEKVFDRASYERDRKEYEQKREKFLKFWKEKNGWNGINILDVIKGKYSEHGIDRNTNWLSPSVDKGDILTVDQLFDKYEADFNFELKEYKRASSEFEKSKQDLENSELDKTFQTGKPVAVKAFHGTPYGEIKGNSFDPEKLGSFTKAPSAKEAYFFAGSEKTSREYAATSDIHGEKVLYEGWIDLTFEEKSTIEHLIENVYYQEYKNNGGKKSLESFTRDLIKDKYNLRDIAESISGKDFSLDTVKKAKILPFFIKFENPLVFDQRGDTYREASYFDLIQKAKKEGRDGVIILDTKDGGDFDIIYAVLPSHEGNIKSANPNTYNDKGNKIGLSKRFDTTNKDIRYMPSEQAEAWRDFKAERTTEGNSILKNAMNYVIIQANNKYKVYNPQKALLGIYTDLDQAKRRVQREEPKQL